MSPPRDHGTLGFSIATEKEPQKYHHKQCKHEPDEGRGVASKPKPEERPSQQVHQEHLPCPPASRPPPAE